MLLDLRGLHLETKFVTPQRVILILRIGGYVLTGVANTQVFNCEHKFKASSYSLKCPLSSSLEAVAGKGSYINRVRTILLFTSTFIISSLSGMYSYCEENSILINTIYQLKHCILAMLILYEKYSTLGVWRQIQH